MPSVPFLVALTMLAVAAGMVSAKGPTLPDRVIAIDLIGVLLVCLLVLMAGVTAQQAFLDVAMVVALITAVGLFAALLGDGVWDSLAWLGLGVSAALGLQGFYPRPRQ